MPFLFLINKIAPYSYKRAMLGRQVIDSQHLFFLFTQSRANVLVCLAVGFLYNLWASQTRSLYSPERDGLGIGYDNFSNHSDRYISTSVSI